ncbi:ventricular zone-expressed PH domain-containing protein-like isoform X2 [Branchiostoma floridae]|uniref:Ventricular zone-expressed PH domain-containing protein-like isoform X1 n=1 Tax=Branchiostoma floridae TaxID=7739 RepID=A0A9J7N946_BRAFL|nr:ventricular zone-expressed PH domain-containing protein-like isoform X1 [Branchiostoma floridae]XP_035697518.1 ventricular zone-expressed PH domain-containing protein-like isoform X2 [Branchiostoma floridae]
MHELFAQVLSKRDLSRAGDLFSIEDSAIVNDLSEVLKRIQEISSRPDYLTNDNDQSVVEICITRVTTAIRETSTIERHGPALVSLWESCLKHNLKPLSRDEDPPHAKIASDIMSCIFQNYSKPSIMKLAVPVAVKFLQQGNRELSRNMSSYLSLAAIENAGLLARHTKHIIDSIIAGNRSLIRVLPQIYREAPDPINKRVPDLVRQLKECDGSERGNLLQLLSLVAKKEPKLMMPYVNTLVDFLPSPPTTTQVLPVLVDMATANATPFVGMLGSLQKTAEQQPMCLSGVARIVGAIGRTDEAEAKDCLIYLVQQLSNADHSSLPVLLGEIKTLVDRNPNQLTDHIKEINRYNDSSSSAARLIVQQLQQQAARSCGSTPTPEGGIDKEAPSPATSPTPQAVQKTNEKLSTTSPSSVPTTSPTQTSPPHESKSPSSLATTTTSSSTTSTKRHSGTKSHSNPNLIPSPSIRNTAVRQPRPVSLEQSIPSSSSSSKAVKRFSSPTPTNGTIHTAAVPSLSTQGLSTSTGSIKTTATRTSTTSTQTTTSNPNLVPSPPKTLPVSASSTSSHLAASLPGPSAMVMTSGPGSTSSLPYRSKERPRSAASLEGKRISLSSDVIIKRMTPDPAPSGVRAKVISRKKAATEKIRNTEKRKSLADQIKGIINFGDSSDKSERGSSETLTKTNDEVDVLQDWSKGKMEDIKDYMSEVNCRVPIPCSCAIEDTKSGSLARLGFMCAKKGEHCLYSRTQFITMSRHPKLWLHLMFLHIQAKERSALSKQDQRIQSLITQWERIKRRGVLTLEGHVMQSQFPSERDQEMLHGQLDEVRFFDLFSYDQSEDNWECFMCSNPDKATGLLQEGQPLIEGQLKEKKVRWKFIRRWRTRYFTLAGAQLVQKSRSKKDDALPIELSKVQSVKVVRKRDRNIPRAFEIFTDNKTYVFKAKDSKNAEQWLQCINIAVAQAKESTA